MSLKILKEFLFLFFISVVIAKLKLQEEHAVEEPINESLSDAGTQQQNLNDNLRLSVPVPDEIASEGYAAVDSSLNPNGVNQVENNEYKREDNTGTVNMDAPIGEANYSSQSTISGNEDAKMESSQHSDEVVYKENLSLREILRRLMPPQLSTIGESELNKDLTGGEYSQTAEEYEKNEDVLPNSGSDASYNSSASGNNSSNVQDNVTTKATNLTKKAVCLEIEREEDGIFDVEILNATTLQSILQVNSNVTTRSSPARCYVVYFFSPYCPFSTQGSAYVNALARSLPSIPVYGLDSIEFHSLNARYGIMGTPSLVLFHNGNVAGRYNASEFSTYYLESFIRHFTDQKLLPINVTSHDFKSNLPCQTLASTPYALYFAWTFLLTCGGYLFLNSRLYATLMEAFVNNWREAEAQHEHDD